MIMSSFHFLHEFKSSSIKLSEAHGAIVLRRFLKGRGNLFGYKKKQPFACFCLVFMGETQDSSYLFFEWVDINS